MRPGKQSKLKPSARTRNSGHTTLSFTSQHNRISALYPNPSNSSPARKPRLITSANNGTELIIFDSGPLIQLHTQEAFSALALQVYREAGRIGACNLVLPEIAGATGAMLRDKRINRAQRKQIQEFVRHNWDTWLILPLTATVCERAFELCQRHPLKGPDALHLAAAQALLRFRPQLRFFTLDRTLYQAAQKEKVPVVVIPEFERGR